MGCRLGCDAADVDRRTPLPSVHRALSLGRLGVDPLEKAVHVENMGALSPD